MIAGNLRHTIVITLQEPSGTGDRGQSTYNVVTLGTVPARIEPLSGRKLEIARQLVPTATHEITIRYLAGVTPNCKVAFGSRVFNIGSVTNRQENNYELTLIVSEAQ